MLTPLNVARLGVLPLALVLLATPVPAADFVNFESQHVHPIALSADGSRLFAVNTPDNRLEVFAVSAAGLAHTASVPVGLEPVAVAARTNTEVWVVNHLSDSVSIVDVAAVPPRVTRTLLVGDEPRDLVFAGPGAARAFITTAHRGQNSPVDPQLTTPGVGRADVWVFDASDLGAPLGGTPLTIVTLFGDTPRALAVGPGGHTVYAAAFHSGNQTTALSEAVVCNGGATAPPCLAGGVTMPGGLPPPNTNIQGIRQPEVGLIVRWNAATAAWEDDVGRSWNNAVRFSLPDEDVFAIDADAAVPVETAVFTGVGTVLFNMVVNPVSGKVYVSNTEARNEVRFEGPGSFGGSTVRGHLQEARITVLDGGGVLPRHLNKHIPYGVVPSPSGVKERSLAIPLGMAVSADGGTLYVAAFGSSKIGILGTAALEDDTFVPAAADHITVSGGGPSGLVLDEPRGRLYVFTRFDNAVSVIDVATRTEVAHVPVFNPEPPSVVLGRPFLYDATVTSSNGEAACASCHIFGDFDSLAWDLGNPDDIVRPNNNEFRLVDVIGLSFDGFHPMKGPMTTQSLRGMANHGPMHWRGDRTGGAGQSLDEDLAFKAFNVAFDGLLGRAGPLTASQMQAFTDFILQVTYPPNPIRNLDNTLTPEQQAGRNFYFGPTSDVFGSCNTCHVLAPASGFFGGDGLTSFEGEPQEFKIPHLRNAYQKVGMFGQLDAGFTVPSDSSFKGDQVRGVGYLHDGSFDTVFRFMHGLVFSRDFSAFGPNPGGFPTGPLGDQMRREVEAFILAFDTNLAPIVGQQATLTSTNEAAVEDRLDLLEERADAGECDLVAKGVVGVASRSWLRSGGGYVTGYPDEPPTAGSALRALVAAAGDTLTYTCVPPGSGTRIGVDHDDDGFPDRVEHEEGTDPDDPASVPSGAAGLPFTRIRTKSLVLTDESGPPANPARRKLVFKSVSSRLEPPALRILPPARGSAGDPTLGGGTIAVYNAAGLSGDRVQVALPAAGWTALGGAAGGFRFRDPAPDAPVTSVKVRADRIIVKARRAGFAYTLDEPAQGQVAVRLSLGAGIRWCAVAVGAEDRVDRFVATPNTPAPTFCPPQP
jgi:YVTN family beta-propeller protein